MITIIIKKKKEKKITIISSKSSKKKKKDTTNHFTIVLKNPFLSNRITFEMIANNNETIDQENIKTNTSHNKYIFFEFILTKDGFIKFLRINSNHLQKDNIYVYIQYLQLLIKNENNIIGILNGYVN